MKGVASIKMRPFSSASMGNEAMIELAKDSSMPCCNASGSDSVSRASTFTTPSSST